MTERISTPNLAEVWYLTSRRSHRIVDVDLRKSWPYEVLELCVTLEGVRISLDHQSYLRLGECDLPQLRQTFRLVQEVIGKKDDAGVYTGSYAGPAHRDWSQS